MHGKVNFVFLFDFHSTKNNLRYGVDTMWVLLTPFICVHNFRLNV